MGLWMSREGENGRGSRLILRRGYICIERIQELLRILSLRRRWKRDFIREHRGNFRLKNGGVRQNRHSTIPTATTTPRGHGLAPVNPLSRIQSPRTISPPPKSSL